MTTIFIYILMFTFPNGTEWTFDAYAERSVCRHDGEFLVNEHEHFISYRCAVAELNHKSQIERMGFTQADNIEPETTAAEEQRLACIKLASGLIDPLFIKFVTKQCKGEKLTETEAEEFEAAMIEFLRQSGAFDAETR